jgi:ubiquinone/menaquinone biosynthesis C-methylase UbiE
MDVFTALNPGSDYSKTTLQLIVGAWVMTTPFEKKSKVALGNGDVSEDDYDKRSIYSLLYSLYRNVGVVENEHGTPYEFTFNTWGYAWPAAWGEKPTVDSDPERFGKNAYTGLFAFPQVKEYVAKKNGKVHVIEMGCGTGAGANQICKNVLPECTYEAFDMQQAAINTAKRKFVPHLKGRLVATRADCTQLPVGDGVADFVVVNETHVTEMNGVVTDEDKRFFKTMVRVLKPGGFLVWGNAIPDPTWQPCFDYMQSIGMKMVESRDVTKEAILARDLDEPRAEAYVKQVLSKYHAFKIPVFGATKRKEARMAIMNFYRNPGTNLYDTMIDRRDTYKVNCLQKA